MKLFSSLSKKEFIIDKTGIIGRDKDCQYNLNHSSVSRKHCEIKIEGEKLLLKDLSSKNGTFVNGEKIQSIILEEGDIIRIGEINFSLIKNGNYYILEECKRDYYEKIKLPSSLICEFSKVLNNPRDIEEKFNASLEELRKILEASAILLIEISGNGRSILKEIKYKSYICSNTVINKIIENERDKIWAPKEIKETSDTLKGLRDLSIFCSLISKSNNKILLFYAYWENGCLKPKMAEALLNRENKAIEKWYSQSILQGEFEKFLREQPLIGETLQFKNLLYNVYNAAKTDTPVILIGEPGTGKTTIARLIHDLSKRAKKPFAEINPLNNPESLFESEMVGVAKGAYTGATEDREGILERADGGTIFLESIECYPLAIQNRLKLAMENKCFTRIGSHKEIKVDIRFIGAINEDPIKLMEEKRLKEDFWDRIAVTKITLPPLRERKEDIPLLANYFLKKAKELGNVSLRGFSDDAINKLMLHPWPGNIRELRNIIFYLALNCPSYIAKDIDIERALSYDRKQKISEDNPFDIIPYKEALKHFKRRYIEHNLKKYGSISKLAKIIKASRMFIYNILKKMN